MTHLVAYLVAVIVHPVIDFVWLGLVAHEFYASHLAQLGELVRPEPNLLAAALFYLVYSIGTVVFAVAPALAAGRWQPALWRGALYGFCAYATYDLTNLATLQGWSIGMSVVDVAWGAVLTGVVATIAYAATRRIRGI